MTWAARRQLKYLSVFFGIILVILAIIIIPRLKTEPTCFDGKQNGDEEGIDCGGSCALICPGQAKEPVILWSRAFPVAGNVYNLIAFVENRNTDKAVYKVDYEFRVYNEKNRLIGRKEGSTFIPPNQEFAIVETRFSSGLEKARSVTFDFASPLIWYKKEPTLQLMPFKIRDAYLEEGDNGASLSFYVVNESPQPMPPFSVIGLLKDINDNVINGSISQREGLAGGQTMSVVLTWPEKLTDRPVGNDIYLSINPFEVPY